YLMGSQFIMARKGAPFLNLWYRSYEIDYRRGWTYNALEVPFELARQNPDLIHVEGNRFTRPNFHTLHLIFNKNYDWSDNYAMHLFTRWYKEDFDETKIGMLNTTIGQQINKCLGFCPA
ncbi:MAG: hypothetical protein N0E55_04550, partial [Candidatus Thiodiazotropha taylori]|nr:hypothetical protein [Candidatus Thiodiazotropha taylori]MCW4251962.1 hypothetical protein [Candidatus Thiodiazotropha taylori]